MYTEFTLAPSRRRFHADFTQISRIAPVRPADLRERRYGRMDFYAVAPFWPLWPWEMRTTYGILIDKFRIYIYIYIHITVSVSIQMCSSFGP